MQAVPFGPTIRAAVDDDLPLLVEMLVGAMNWDGLRGTTTESVESDPLAWHYVEGWRRPDDFGVVAMDGAIPVGAAWARILIGTNAGYGYVDDETPELTLAVSASARRGGTGSALLAGLIDAATGRGLTGLSLSVEDGNAGARRLYERVGFVVVGRSGNSDTMLLRLQG